MVTLRPLGSKRRGKIKLRALHYHIRLSKAKSIKTFFSVLSPPKCQSQAVVRVSTPRIYPQSGNFLVLTYFISVKINTKESIIGTNNHSVFINETSGQSIAIFDNAHSVVEYLSTAEHNARRQLVFL